MAKSQRPVVMDKLSSSAHNIVMSFSHQPVQTPSVSVGISGCNSVKSGGPKSISEHNPQQFHGWNRMESLV
jgi:hypothetical protein